MENFKLRMWNPAGKKYLYDIDNVFECLKQQHKFDGTMPDRGFVNEWDHRNEGMKWEMYSEFEDSLKKQICEGDIVHHYRFLADQSGFIGVVCFKDGQFIIEPTINILPTSLAGHLDRIKIIGNINENPEYMLPENRVNIPKGIFPK
jgi:hypothetical protein